MILSLFGKDRTHIEPAKDRLGHDRRYRVDSSKLRSLGWESEHNFENALEDIVKWYKENELWWKPIKSGEYKAYYEKQYVTS